MLIPSQHTHVLYVGTTPQWKSDRKSGTEKDVTSSKAGSETLVVIFTSCPFVQLGLLVSWVTPVKNANKKFFKVIWNIK